MEWNGKKTPLNMYLLFLTYIIITYDLIQKDNSGSECSSVEDDLFVSRRYQMEGAILTCVGAGRPVYLCHIQQKLGAAWSLHRARTHSCPYGWGRCQPLRSDELLKSVAAVEQMQQKNKLLGLNQGHAVWGWELG